MAPKKPISDRSDKPDSSASSRKAGSGSASSSRKPAVKPASSRRSETPSDSTTSRSASTSDASTRRPAPTPPSRGSVFQKPDARPDSKPPRKGKTSRKVSRKGEDSDDFLPAKEGKRAYERMKLSEPGVYDAPRNTDFQKKPPSKKKRPANLPPKRLDKNSPKQVEFETKTMSDLDNSYRLNKYIANSGVCSRREADTLIAEGKVSINGKVVTDMGVKVSKKDRVTVDGSAVNPVDFVYILLNKPKNYITTTDDEKGRNTVMELIEDATGHRVYPVGRLDRHTTGLLLLTNDGDLANRLMHPKYEVRKVYEVMSQKDFTDEQLKQLVTGVTLEDGPAQPHRVQRVPGSDQVIQVTVFEGRNHLIRRMMEAIGHPSIELARITYGGLHIKGIRNGRWRYLRPNEVNELRTLVKLFNLDKKDTEGFLSRKKK